MVTFIFWVLVVPLLTAIITQQLVIRTLPKAISLLVSKEVLMSLAENQDPQDFTEGKHTKRDKESMPRLVITLIVSAFIIISIAGQSLLYQRAQAKDALNDRRHDEKVQVCIEVWANEMRTAASLARSFTKELEDALENRNEALDAIVLLFVEANALPEDEEPSAELLERFNAALSTFVQAKVNLTKVKAKVDKDRVENPYPSIDLDCKEGRAAAERVK